MNHQQKLIEIENAQNELRLLKKQILISQKAKKKVSDFPTVKNSLDLYRQVIQLDKIYLNTKRIIKRI